VSVVVIDDVEHWLPDWHPYDATVRAGVTEVVAWITRRSGAAGPRVHNSVAVASGLVTAVVFRAASVPESRRESNPHCQRWSGIGVAGCRSGTCHTATTARFWLPLWCRTYLFRH
jgi:hypothetical protein